MSDVARRVVLNHLVGLGWSASAAGEVGEIWTRGVAEAVVPYDLEVGTSPWNRLAVALAKFEGEPVDDVLESWNTSLKLIRNAAVHAGPRNSTDGGRVQLELHLEGPTVRGHETSAYTLGRFIMRTADSVKELVKSSLGIDHLSRDLLVAGGPGPGSVKVTFVEPDRSAPRSMFPEPPETAEGQALVFMAGLFTAADSMVGEVEVDALRSRLAPLGVGARLSVARVADVVTDGGWNLRGVIRRGSQEEGLTMGLAGAQILGQTSREQQPESTDLPVSGTIDGWRWSRSELNMITDDRRNITVSVPMELQHQVAELHLTPDNRVVAMLRVYTEVIPGTRDALRRTYALKAIQPVMSEQLWPSVMDELKSRGSDGLSAQD
ncbi:MULTISPECIES: hypothetical protein [unclassified Knoellia]|uniref:hypothetical protein n=1 Tax=Knoellia altitudinis TaxID=3404795 RepID=UPI0036161C01